MPSVINDEALHQQFLSSIREILPAKQIVETTERIFGSEDFGYVTRNVPSLMIFLGAKVSELVYGQHHPKVIFHEDNLVLGCAAFLQCLMHIHPIK